ncbi:hypothetical protein BC830DRAFT_744891 [Chytriomyces sp. MP71]|nr:hypothetical protein BC830DRAFT_744891 [Chytriomyces sp. MP71]
MMRKFVMERHSKTPRLQFCLSIFVWLPSDHKSRVAHLCNKVSFQARARQESVMYFRTLIAAFLVPISILAAPTNHQQQAASQFMSKRQIPNLTPDQVSAAFEKIISNLGTTVATHGTELLTDLQSLVKGATDLATGNPLGIMELSQGLSNVGNILMPVILDAIQSVQAGTNGTAALVTGA